MAFEMGPEHRQQVLRQQSICKEGIIHIMRCENCGEDKDVSEVPVLRKVRILG